MGQKINSTSFRLGKRLSWEFLWSVKKTNFGFCLYTSKESRYVIQKKIEFSGVFINHVFLSRTNKDVRILINTFLKRNASKNILKNNFNDNIQGKIYKRLKDLFFLNSKNSLNVHFFPSFFPWYFCEALPHSKKLFYWPYLNPKVISNYISQQLSTARSKKSVGFKRNLLSGILEILTQIFRNYSQQIISGFKISCVGKWRQTSNGRSQKTTISIGNVSKQTLDQIILSASSITTTKYGACNIRVWVCYKKL